MRDSLASPGGSVYRDGMDHWITFDHTHDDEEPPTLGVREPRKPYPPTLTGGAQADLLWTPEPVEAVAGASVSR